MKAIAYRRFSSKIQISGNSELRQKTGFDEFLASSGLTAWHDEYFDKGESAYHGNHRSAEFGRLLTDCQAKKFPVNSVIWVEDMDRFGRGELFTVEADWNTITRNGYKIHVGTLGRTFDASTSQMERMGAIMKSILANDESQKKSDKGKSARANIRKTGLTKNFKRLRNCPFWISVVDGEYKLNAYADLVRDMFRLSADGWGCVEIANELGNPTRTIKGKEKAIDVLSVVRNRAAIGEQTQCVRVGKNERKEVGTVANYYPAVIEDEDLFFRVQAGLDSRRQQRGRKGPTVTNLFTELVRGDDGLPMHIKCMIKGKKLLRRKTKGANRSWDYAQIEFTLLRFMSELTLTGEVAQEDHSGLLADIESNIAKNEALLESVPSEAIARVIQKLEIKRQTLQDEIERQKGRTPVNTSLVAAKSILESLDGVTGDALLNMRTRLKNSVRKVINRIDVEIDGPACMLSVQCHNGERRRIILNRGRKVEYNNVCDSKGTIEVWRIKVA